MKLRTYTQTFKASAEFPRALDETWTVRNGQGKPVEEWTVTRNLYHGEGSTPTGFEVSIRELRPRYMD